MRYEAFISYSHSDELSARRIQLAIERYRIPTALATELNRSHQRFAPVFRDKEELAGSADLSDALQQALADSRSLIVVCSGAASRSRWVNAEVEAFQKLGRGDRIYAVVVDGNPADPASCLPPALHNRELLALDLRKQGDSLATVRLKLAASLLGVGYDRLKQRHVRYRRQRLAMQFGFGLIFAGVLAATTYQFAIAPPCTDSARLFDATWNPTQAQALTTKFQASGLPFAADSARRVNRIIDTYAKRWTQMHQQTCEATLVHSNQSPQLMDLRMACLDERRTESSSVG